MGTAKKPVDLDRMRARLIEQGLYEVVQAICLEHNVRVVPFLMGVRRRSIARARRHVCFILRTKHKMSNPEIGRALGLDHSSVTYAIRKWIKEQAVEPTL